MFNFYHVDQMVGQTSSWLDLFKYVAPILTLIVGLFWNRWFSKHDKLRADEKSTEDLLTEIELLEESMKKQQDSVKAFIIDLRSAKDEELRFTSLLQLNMERLKVLDRGGIVDHLERILKDRPRAIHTANKLLIGCDVVAIKYKALKDNVEDYIAISIKIHDQWREEVNYLHRLASKTMTGVERQGQDPNEDPLVVALLALTQRSLKEDKDIFEVYENMQKPLLSLFGEHRRDPRIDSLNEANTKALQTVQKLERERSSTATRLEKIAKSLDTGYSGLLDEAHEIRSLL